MSIPYTMMGTASTVTAATFQKFMTDFSEHQTMTLNDSSAAWLHVLITNNLQRKKNNCVYICLLISAYSCILSVNVLFIWTKQHMIILVTW